MARTIFIFILILLAGGIQAQEIIAAAAEGHLEKVKEILGKNPQQINITDSNGRTPLHWASRGVHPEVIRYLLDKGAIVNAKDSNGSTALHSTASRSHLEASKLLIEKGADVTAKNNSGATPLYYAAFGGNRELLKYLISQGADKNDLELKNAYGRTPLCAIARDGGNAEVIKALIDLGANPDAADYSGKTPIMLAAWRRNEDVVNVLLKAGADLQINTPNGEELLTYSARGMENLFQTMAENKASLNILTNEGRTLLHSAAAGGSIKIIKILFEKGFNVNQKDKFGWTPLHIAAEQGQRENISFLLAKGADINARNQLGETSYNIAQDREDEQLVEFLKSCNADTSVPAFPKITGKYLGQTAPEMQSEVFAPGIVSHRYKPHSTVAISPQGDEIFWNPMIIPRGGGYSYGYIMTTRIENGVWIHPEKAFFSRKDFLDDHPIFSPDGQKLFFLSSRPFDNQGKTSEQRTWFIEKTKDGWSEAKLFDKLPVPTLPSTNFLTFSFDEEGNYYFVMGDDIYVSFFTGGKYSTPQNLGSNINTTDIEGGPFISPDGSYLLFVRQNSGPYVCFKKDDKTWGEAISIKNQAGNTVVGNFTLSGNFLMIGDRCTNIGFIEDLRPKE